MVVRSSLTDRGALVQAQGTAFEAYVARRIVFDCHGHVPEQVLKPARQRVAGQTHHPTEPPARAANTATANRPTLIHAEHRTQRPKGTRVSTRLVMTMKAITKKT